ncbi:MAG: cation:proton antiporter [Polyangia bacterium]|jgi:Kef-type K+ transport system membrane component KefB|nr:cation:proton antiporter [Polyangia bacterium]
MNRLIFLLFLPLFLLLPAVAHAGGGGGEGGLDLVSAIGVAIGVAGVLMVLFNLLKLPALLAYIVSGLVLSALASRWLSSSVPIMEHISHLGLVFLLFIIGLEMDLRGILRLGTRTALAVLLQAPIAIGAVLGVQYGAAALGFSIPGLGTAGPSFFFFAVACALGSTAVVVKLLGDKFDLDSKAGKITVLTLIAQDIWAVAALSYVASTTGGKGTSLALMLGGGIGAAAAMVLFARYALGRIMATLAKAPDLMALLAIGWCFLCALAMSQVGLSAEMGALIAGLTMGALPQHVEVLAKVSSLRDFFMALFFVALGMTLPSPTMGVMLEALALVGIVILVRMLLFTPTLFASRLGPIVSLAAPINLAQISEFTLLLVPLGIAGGALSKDQGAVISYGLMLSVVVTSFAIANNYRLARRIGRYLPGRGVSAPGEGGDREEGAPDEALGPGGESGGHGPPADIVMLGFFLNAEALAAELKRTSPELLARTLVVDYNLQNHAAIKAHGFRVAYGDISNPETLRHHGIAHAKVVLSTISNTFLRGTSNQALAQQVRNINPEALFIATADDERSASVIQDIGVFRVVVPPVQAAPVFAQALRDALAGGGPAGRGPEEGK